jgi:hypothetical protein
LQSKAHGTPQEKENIQKIELKRTKLKPNKTHKKFTHHEAELNKIKDKGINTSTEVQIIQ